MVGNASSGILRDMVISAVIVAGLTTIIVED
jgi:hypothetical protein